jgi:hypothetical protein
VYHRCETLFSLANCGNTLITGNLQGIKEGLRVSSDITSSDLCSLIRETLKLPLAEYCGSVLYDINEMVIRDASNAGWMRVNPHSDVSYFGDMFLKPHPRKKDGGLIFSIPANMKPPVFGLVFNQAVWKKVEEFREAEVCYNAPTYFSSIY